MIADEFPTQHIVSPLILGGTYGALQLATDDVITLWQRALLRPRCRPTARTVQPIRCTRRPGTIPGPRDVARGHRVLHNRPKGALHQPLTNRTVSTANAAAGFQESAVVHTDDLRR